MNDPGLEGVIQLTENKVEEELDAEVRQRSQSRQSAHNSREPNTQTRLFSKLKYHANRKGQANKNRKLEDTTKSRNLYQHAAWWFFSTAFPLICGSFGPIANLFSVCALVNTWRVDSDNGSRISDPRWLIAVNSCSLAVAVVANLVLLFNFARRIRYAIAQPITISLWYIAALLLFVPIGLFRQNRYISSPHSSPSHAIPIGFSESFYYALISALLYSVLSTMLLISTLGSTSFVRAYPPSFSTLTHPQRTLMLQTTSLTIYMGIGALVFSTVEEWNFADGVYWADYTVLTIGLGSDFPLRTTLGRMLLIPYAIGGITMIGLIVGSVRQLVLDRAKTKVVRRFLAKKRERWGEEMRARQHAQLNENGNPTSDPAGPVATTKNWLRQCLRILKRGERRVVQDMHDHLERHDGVLHRPAWHRMEYELMRFIEKSAETTEHYFALGASFMVILVVWTMGALVFWECESKEQGWRYVDTIYFTYTTLLTIGYGDFYPKSTAGRPFFVIWSLISVPAMTVLISNMGDTVVKWVRDGTVKISRWTILPERDDEDFHDQKADPEASGPEGMKGEEARDRAGTHLAAIIAKEISMLAKDLNEKPVKKYTWDEWERWLGMLGKIESDIESGAPHTRSAQTHVCDDHDHMGAEVEDVAPSHHSIIDEDDWEWTWLGDDGPLFSQLTETEWIIRELCVKLEEVIGSLAR